MERQQGKAALATRIVVPRQVWLLLSAPPEFLSRLRCSVTAPQTTILPVYPELAVVLRWKVTQPGMAIACLAAASLVVAAAAEWLAEVVRSSRIVSTMRITSRNAAVEAGVAAAGEEVPAQVLRCMSS
jgi:hypothetical protein